VTCLLADTNGRWSDVRQASRKLLIGILPGAPKRAASAAVIVDAAHMEEVSPARYDSHAHPDWFQLSSVTIISAVVFRDSIRHCYVCYSCYVCDTNMFSAG
jgi:hypothetical protein